MIRDRLGHFTLAVMCLALLPLTTRQAEAVLIFGNASFSSATFYLDYTNFETRLNETAVAAGVTPFSPSEVTTIKSQILSVLNTSFAPFTALNFSDVDPGGSRPEMRFGETAPSFFLGGAEHFDFLNTDPDDIGRVFSGNFDFILDEFSGTSARSTQINQIAGALGGTAVHEIGHNMGLRHHDAYSSFTFTGSIVNTGGGQNQFVMSGGNTGVTEEQREGLRVFSANSLVKLIYAQGTLPTNPVPITEAADAGATTGTAMPVAFEPLTIAGRFGEVVRGNLTSISDVDVFAVDLIAGSTLTADINNDYAVGSTATDANTKIEVLNPSGVVIASNSISSFGFNIYGPGGVVEEDEDDPAVFNVPINVTGTYFVRVMADTGVTIGGDYQLLMHTNISAVPEPSSLLLLGLAGIVAGVGHYGRRRASVALHSTNVK